MSTFTRQAIISSFMKLADEKPINKISVKDIVEDCGVNRNTFYYHFEDIPALVETVLKQQADFVLNECKEIRSIENCFEVATNYAAGRKKVLLHIYNSVSRDTYEKYLMKICEYLVQVWFNSAFPACSSENEIKTVILRMLKCELFGFIIDWLNNSMNEESLAVFRKMSELREGEIESILSKKGLI